MALLKLPPDNRQTGTSITALNQAVTLTIEPGHTSWTVQATGTFISTFVTEVTLDGTTWIPVNSRQSGTGALKNSFDRTGVFRGSCGGLAQFRVRCSSYTSGTAVISASVSAGVGAIFSNSIVLTQEQEQYYTSTAGGNMAFNATPGLISIGNGGGLAVLFENPAASTVDVYISRIIMDTENAGRFERYRGGTITTRGTAATEVNRGGNSAITAQAKVYGPSGTAVTGGTLGKVTYMTASDETENILNGSLILRPGQNIYFRFNPNTAVTTNTSIEIVWWESGALT